MAETPGGLRKISLQFTPEQMAWLQGRAARKGGASVASVVRELVSDAMTAEYRMTTTDIDVEQG